MTMLAPTLAISVAVTALSVGFAVVCFSLILVVLAQKPKGGGLAGAFGGGGGSEGAFVGAKIGDVLTWITVGFFVAFIGLAMGLTWAINPEPADFADPTVQTTTTTPPATAPATGAPATTTPDEPAASATIDLSTPVPTPEESPIPAPATDEPTAPAAPAD